MPKLDWPMRCLKEPWDAWVPSYVVKKNDDLSAFYILIEFGQSSIASKLLGDAVNLHTIDDKPFVGAWVNKAFKTTWRMSSSTVPHGKALQSSATLELEDISEAFINDIADPAEPPLPPQQHAFQVTGEASASSSSEGVFPYPPMPSHAPPYVAPGPHPHQPVVPQGSHVSTGHGPAALTNISTSPSLKAFLPITWYCLHQGVPQSLGLLRRYKYFVALDIVQAFLQIELPLVEDQRCLGFFWCNQAFVFQRVCFGMPDSPLAMSDSLAKAMVEADAPTKHVRCLMDDISVGSDDARHLTALRRDITQRLSHRMFETNHKKEVSNLPDQIPSDPQPCLGVRWHPNCDSLSLKSDLRHKASTVTTVKLLKRYGNGFYDPLGWHLELSMQLRLLCRQARSNADPHTGHLRSEDTQALVAWENQLKAFDLRVPRLLRRPGESHCNSVCLFTDSSDTAGAALLYTLHGQRIAGSGYLHQLQGRRTAPKFELDTLASSLEWASAMLQESNDHSPVHHLLVFTDSSISISRLRQVTPTTAHSVEDLVTIRRVLKVKNAIHQLQTRCEGLHVVVSHLSGKSNLADAPSRCQPKSLSIDSDALFCHIRAFHDDLLRCNDGDLQGSPMIFRLDSEYVPTALPTRWSKKESSKPKVTLASLGAATTSSPAGESEKTDQEAFTPDDDSLHLLERLYRFKLLVKAWHALRTELLPGTPASSTSTVADPLRLLIRHQQRLHLKAFHKLPFHFKTDEGLIYRSTRQAGDGTIFNQLVVPKQSTLLQRLLVIKCHGWHHGGINATLRRLSTMYAWPRMKRTVVPVCRCCRSCLSAKSQRPLHAPAGTFAAPTAVWQYIGLDHTGPYDVPVREGSQRLPYCLVATCLLSGYQLAVAVSSTSLEQTTLAFKKILALAGVPKGLRCDNSQSFRGSEFRCLCLSYSIEMQFIYSRSPQRGGAYERHHAELNEQLRLLQARDQPWDLTVLEATARSNARFRWDDSALVNSPWDLAHTYPYLQCAALSPPVDPTLPKAFQEPSARVSEWLLSTWEKDREGRRVRAGDKAATVNTGDIVYLKLPRRVTKLSSSTTGPFRVLQRCGNSVKLTPTTGANRYRSVFFQPIDNVVRTVSEPVHDSDTPLPGPPESHQVPDESIPDKATSAETTVSPQVEADSSKALASAQDDVHVNDTASSALPSKAFNDTVIHEPSSTSSRPRTKRATVPRRTGDPHPEVKNFAYITSSGRGGLQYGRVISVDQGLYRLQLADRSADGNSLHLRSDMVSSPTAHLLRVQGDSDDFPDNKTDFRLTRASVRFLDNLKTTKR
ncbi:hypothetical protein FOZ60_016418 [Perkinsus olseni]|uniref:Integrase catalytic domain-containing protein n=1 Tax=Perkinsus olseni TaxID=32597 RepID=A0A7J6N4H2_PEROL|nr:hypothetical protein FOZ60_016418 [Perkinsus olseni]